ncbi:MAG: pantoate--beta-alanine ligase [Thiotrichaceae bacterium]|nr:pantoate--beta-alanine ligase [Thiotrichaceae bacterium]
MIVCDDIKPLRQYIKQWRQEGKTIALVPTMGNLHQGHLSLVAEAKQHADITITSIFVNSTQFSQAEDLHNYPRTLDADLKQLKQSTCDLVFTPDADVMYPSQAFSTHIEVTGISTLFEGASRPGHFSGVATIVAKLFNLTTPDYAIFGEKDFQQLLLIRQMVSDLNFDIKVISKATSREKNGLAMSSRNSQLTDKERIIASAFYRQLQWIKKNIKSGHRDFLSLSQQASQKLNQLGFKTDYITVCRQYDLAIPTAKDKDLVILAATQLGQPRLIDNITLEI